MQYGISNLSIIPMRKQSADQAEMVNQILFGEHFKVLEAQKKWSKIRLAHDSYEGWICNKQWEKISEEDYKQLDIDVSQDIYADNILKNYFNLSSLNALDYSSFEKADIIHDLNLPLNNYKKQFDTILDFGTSEHVFNIVECFKNISLR